MGWTSNRRGDFLLVGRDADLLYTDAMLLDRITIDPEVRFGKPVERV